MYGKSSIFWGSGSVMSCLTNVKFLASCNSVSQGGVGSGSLDFYANTPLPEDRITFKEGGFTYSLGVGYEFRVSGGLAFGFSYDYTKIDMGDFRDITGAATVNQVLAVSFHFYNE